MQTRKVTPLIESTSPEELSKATEVVLRKAGKRDSASIVKELCFASPTRGTNLKKARKASLGKPDKLTPDQALSLLVDAKLSKNQYNIIRSQAQGINCKIYPSYDQVKQAKAMCYPNNINVTETCAEIPLQDLIDHTVKRLCTVQEDCLQTCDERTLDIICKWGCDGSQQTRYHQNFSDGQSTDENLFSVSMVPIQIYNVRNNRKSVVWQNPAPSSTRYCRPIKFMFAKETVDVITSAVKEVEQQIENLIPTRIVLGEKEFIVKAKMIFCMIDGKVCNAVASSASTQRCYLCGAKPSDMNNLQALSQREVDRSFLNFGLSPLHARVRFLECVLHISYRLDIRTWQARGKENKKKVSEKKKIVQEKIRSELGLLVDVPKQQAGNTNDGNTARKLFRNADKFSEITGVNRELIYRFCVILECLNCGFPVDADKFGVYCRTTLDLYLQNYHWYPLPVSVHKVLFHGKDIIAASIIPIGQLSEEAQEARNKDSRKYRELFTRKDSRVHTNTDLLHRLLITSDPLIANMRARAKTKRSEIMPDVLELLRETSLEVSDTRDTDSDL